MLDALEDGVGWIAVVANHPHHLLLAWVAEVQVQSRSQFPALSWNACRKVWKADVCWKSKKWKMWWPLVFVLVAGKFDLLHGAEHEESNLDGLGEPLLGKLHVCQAVQLKGSSAIRKVQDSSSMGDVKNDVRWQSPGCRC